MNEFDNFYDKELSYLISNWTNISNLFLMERLKQEKLKVYLLEAVDHLD